MKNYKAYGKEPYELAVIHGGPGGAGDVREVASYLSSFYSVLEPFQTQKTVQGQLDELKQLIKYPITIIAYSWGAMLSILFAFQNPKLIKKLILIGCPPLDQSYAKSIKETRINRLNEKEKEQLENCLSKMTLASKSEGLEIIKLLQSLTDKTDSFNPIAPISYDNIDFDMEIYESVWPEAAELRSKGVFIKCIQSVEAPITFIHGKYDPHPIEAIENIVEFLKNSKLYALEKCGHTPWYEKEAQTEFYEILKKEIS